MSSRVDFMVAILVATVIFLGVNVIAKSVFYGSAIDLTEDKIFTLSDETKTVIQELDEPLDVKFFYSEKQANGLPVFQAYATRIRGLLQQYAQLSGGTIKVSYYDPQPFTEEEDLAVTHELQGVPIDAVGNKFYFGMSIENSTDDRGTIPFFDPARDTFLEYDMTRLVHDVANPERKKLGILSTLPMRGGSIGGMIPRGQWAVFSELKEHFDVKVLNTKLDRVPDHLDMLMLVHPHSLSDETLYVIEQYILGGGKALIFLDSHVNDFSQEIKSSRLDKILSHWGVSLVPDKIVAEKEAALQVQSSDQESRLSGFPNVTWLELDKRFLAQDSVVTASLNKVRMIDSGYFKLNDDADIRLEPLITTTPAGALVDAKDIRGERDTLKLYRSYLPEGEPLVLAAQVKGVVKSAFKPNVADGQHLKTSGKPINVILVGDTDMLRDEYWVQEQNFFGDSIATPTADNGAFVFNALEFLGGNDALIDLRTRGTKDRRFTVLDDIKRKAELSFREEEERLKMQLKDMEARMRELQSSPQKGGQLFTDAQAQEVQGFRLAFLQTRKDLRRVQRQLNEDIQRLGTRIGMLNIVAVPLVILLLAFILPVRLRRAKKVKGAS